MIYLIVQTFILLLIAGLLGLILGWYLTRISAASGRASLQTLLSKAETDARELRAELDALSTAKHNCDSERRLLSDELADLRARQDTVADSADSDEVISVLQGELAQCREALAAASAGAAEHSEQEADPVAIASAAAAAASGAQGLMGGEPAAMGGDVAPADDLQRIRGIGPKIAGILKQLGVERFEQIAAWTPENIDSINAHLKFKGRVEREEWIPQAKVLITTRDA
jgi:predicted flap endonuclease-1-like 5' DNA nuclease